MDIKHFLQLNDLTRAELEHVFERTRIIKKKFKSYEKYWPLVDRTLVMIFEKASTRTRISFEAGMQQLGGSAIHLSTRDSQLGRGEPVEDAAQVISRMSDIVMIRTFEQSVIERFAANSRVPVINGLMFQLPWVTKLNPSVQGFSEQITTKSLLTRWMRHEVRIWSVPTFGPVWASRQKMKSG